MNFALQFLDMVQLRFQINSIQVNPLKKFIPKFSFCLANLIIS